MIEFVAFIGKSMRALRAFFVQSHLIYLFGVTLLVMFFGAIAVFLFERDAIDSPLRTFGDALWWSFALLTTIGSEMAPMSTGGRIVGGPMMIFAMVVVVYLIGAASAFLLASKTAQSRISLAPSRADLDGALGDEQQPAPPGAMVHGGAH